MKVAVLIDDIANTKPTKRFITGYDARDVTLWMGNLYVRHD
jgi:hypothetical protein